MACALAFAKLCADAGAQYASLDEWLISWAKWVIEPQELCDKLEDAEAVTERRKVQCAEGGYKLFSIPVTSFKTYLNACGRAHNQVSETRIVVSSNHQFQELQLFLSECVRRYRSRKAQKQAEQPDAEVLSQEEYLTIMAKPSQNVIDEQRRNMLALAFCTGLRASSIERLQCNSFKEGKSEDGRKGR